MYLNNLHPYGITPQGNAFLQSYSTKLIGLGNFKIFSDSLVLDILSYLNGIELSYLSQTSLSFYIFCHHVDLWRDLTLKLCYGKSCSFISSWKDTYIHLYTKKSFPFHIPIKVSSFCSDLLYRSWVTREFDLERTCPGFYSFTNVDKRDISQLSLEQFIENYEKPNIPVVITGLVTQWPAFQKWNFDYLKTNFPSKIFRATSGTSNEPASFTIEDYESYAHSKSYEEVPLYLFDRNFAINTNLPDSERIYNLSDDYTVPNYFTMPLSLSSSIESLHKTDLFSILSNDMRPDYRWLIIGPHRSGSIFHIDPNQTHAWNACIKGRKKWIFYPPSISPPGVYVTDDGSDVTVPLSTGEWLLSFWKYHLLNRPSLTHNNNNFNNNNNNNDFRYGSFNYCKPLEIIVEEGELIYVPHGWWHMVVNLDTDCIALTQNYVSTTNLVDCYEFLKDKSDQISGLRDCYNTDEFKQEFYKIFEDKLNEKYPSLCQEMLDKYRQRKEECVNRNNLNRKKLNKLNEIFSKTNKMKKSERNVENNENEKKQFLDFEIQRRKRSNSNYSDDNNSNSNGSHSHNNNSHNSNNNNNHNHPKSKQKIQLNGSHDSKTNSSSLESNSNSFSFSFNFS